MLYPFLSALALTIAAVGPEPVDEVLTKSDHMKTLMQNCMTTGVYADRPDAPIICACGAGFMAAALNDRQYAMIALLSEAGLDAKKMTLIMGGMVKEGFASEEEVRLAANTMVMVGALADEVCIASDPKSTAAIMKALPKPKD